MPKEAFSATFLVSLIAMTMANKGEIRCYCNLAVCVSTGYMCKSTSGDCFTEVSSHRDIGYSRHGCVEMLHQARREACQKHYRNITKIQMHQGKFPLLMCCKEDMCNYVDSMDIKIHLSKRTNQSDTHRGLPSPMDDGEFFFGKPPDGARRQDVWFKAAVIAVPIAGGFILIMLILLAVHMLRKDNRRQRQTVELRRLRQFKAHLLVDDEAQLGSVVEKNHTNMCSGRGHEKDLLKATNMYANVNIAISRDPYSMNEKHANYKILHKPFNNSLSNAVVGTWSSGKSSSTPV